MATARLLSGPRLGLGLLALLVLLGGGRGSARADEDMPLRVATAPYRGTVVDGKTGILVKNEGLLAEALRSLLIDEKRRLTFGRQAAAYIAAERSLDAGAAHLKRLLSAL